MACIQLAWNSVFREHIIKSIPQNNIYVILSSLPDLVEALSLKGTMSDYYFHIPLFTCNLFQCEDSS